ncbi:MAG: SRPBCC domain-containing protein [Acidobacteriota bacterium]
MTALRPPGLALELDRWFAAPIERVFEAFTDPALLQQWWGPNGFVIEELTFPARVGESYRVALRAPDGSRYAHVGRFREVSPPTRLSYSWEWVEGPLQRGETMVELTFEREGDGTRVVLRHSHFGDSASRDAHRGWPDSFDRLVLWLADRDPQYPSGQVQH